jgi:hypothetical protein
VFVENSKILPGSYWTSGSDINCNGKYAWCAVKKTVRGTNFTATSDASKNCISITISKSEAVLKEEDCNAELNIICEVFASNLILQNTYLLDYCTL